MSLQTYIPGRALSPYVQMLWLWEGYHPPHARERILPTGMMEITINLCDAPFVIYPDPARLVQPERVYGPMAAGARSRPFAIETTQPASILAVWFKPGGALPILGAAGDELHNLHLPLDSLWGADARDLYDRLLHACTAGERFMLLETALLRRLRAGRERHRAVEYALALMQRDPAIPRISEVLSQIALGPTRFIQLFSADVGMTPKTFSRVQRFQASLRLIAARRDLSWTEIALRCGYYDQAHFINDFRALAGIAPTAYAPQFPDHLSNLPLPD